MYLTVMRNVCSQVVLPKRPALNCLRQTESVHAYSAGWLLRGGWRRATWGRWRRRSGRVQRRGGAMGGARQSLFGRRRRRRRRGQPSVCGWPPRPPPSPSPRRMAPPRSITGRWLLRLARCAQRRQRAAVPPALRPRRTRPPTAQQTRRSPRRAGRQASRARPRCAG